MLLESAPFASFFVPGFASMMVLGTVLHNDPLALAALVPIGAVGLVIGHLTAYVPARQARAKINWKEKADERLQKTQIFFQKWGFWAVFFGGWWGWFRPFISIAAGLGNMRLFSYMIAIISGSVAWIVWVFVWSALVFGGTLS